MGVVVGLASWLSCTVAFAAEHHVTVDGTARGDGTRAAPWDLATAFAHPAAVMPGDTIWLHGGTYPVEGTLDGAIVGTAEAPVLVKAVAGERVTLDTGDSPDNRIAIGGAFAWYQGFEVMSSAEDRWADDGATADRGYSIDVYGSEGIKLVNLVVHDTQGAVGFWTGAVTEPEIYGCIIYYNGFDATDRGHGHGIYTQNIEGPKYLRDNIIFGQYSHGIHAYTEGAEIDDFVIEGNIAFENGVVSTISGRTRNILVGGAPVAQAPAGRDNVCWFPRDEGEGTSFDFGYGSGTSDPVVERNVIVGGGTALRIDAPSATVSDNVIVGPSNGADAASHPDNAWHPDSAPSEPHVAVRPNAYDPDRAHVVVVNWARAAEIDVDLSPALSPGDTFALVDAQDLYGEPVLEATFEGEPIAVPMIPRSVAAVIGEPATPYVHTGPELGVFVLLRTGFDPGAADSTGPDSGADTTAAGDQTGAGEGDDGSATTGGDEGPAATGVDSSPSATESTGQEQGDASGCGCTSTPRPSAPLALGLGVLAIARRRRRACRARGPSITTPACSPPRS